MDNFLVLGNRVPYEYFLTKGKGESNAGSEGLPYETGSYDAALNDAGIQNSNVIEYTSVIPVGAKEIPKEEGLKRLNWGEVLEVIKKLFISLAATSPADLFFFGHTNCDINKFLYKSKSLVKKLESNISVKELDSLKTLYFLKTL